MTYLLCFLGDRCQSGLNLFESGLQITPHFTLRTDLRHLKRQKEDVELELNENKIHTLAPKDMECMHAHTHACTDLVAIMGLVLEANGHTKSVVVVLQENVPVLVLVQFSNSPLELLQPCAQVLLDPPATGQVGPHHPAQGEVVPCI